VKRVIFLFFISLFYSDLMFGVDYEFMGQASAWVKPYVEDEVLESDYGIRYLPNLNLSSTFSDARAVDLDSSLNIYASSDDSSIKPYRFYLRYTTEQSETRLGLQKINFGPAILLRPLMWFDQVSHEDPLKLTVGVWSLLYKYNFLNNANGWLWSLYGNSDIKGNEIVKTEKKSAEFGGRFQFPLLDGEFAVTSHYRKVNDYIEKRVAFDGRWDVEVGLWFEAVIIHGKFEEPYKWTKMVTVGIDYTFNIGSGLYMVFEQNIRSYSNELRKGDGDNISAFHATYPVTILDSVNASGYFFWNQRKYAQYAGWQRVYDNWIISLNLFFKDFESDKSALGAEAMVIFNH